MRVLVKRQDGTNLCLETSSIYVTDSFEIAMGRPYEFPAVIQCYDIDDSDFEINYVVSDLGHANDMVREAFQTGLLDLSNLPERTFVSPDYRDVTRICALQTTMKGGNKK